jgi:hypothetical protein
MKNSPLIEIFRKVHISIQDNFYLVHRSVCHAPANLSNTLDKLTGLLQKHHAYENLARVATADTAPLPDHFRRGMLIMQKEKSVQFGTSGNDDEGESNMEDSSHNAGNLELDDIGGI